MMRAPLRRMGARGLCGGRAALPPAFRCGIGYPDMSRCGRPSKERPRALAPQRKLRNGWPRALPRDIADMFGVVYG